MVKTMRAVLLAGLLTIFLAALGPAAAAAPTSPPTAAPPPQNVLLIIADDIGVDKLGSYAGDANATYEGAASYLPQTPVIDDMAARGLRFTDAWASPTCSPTRAGIMTGRHGFRTGVGDVVYGADSTVLDLAETTIAEVAADAGYKTALIGKWHLGENDPPAEWAEGETWSDHQGTVYEYQTYPISHGFDDFMGTLKGGLGDVDFDGSYTDWLYIESSTCAGCVDQTVSERRTDYATTAIVDEATAWINAQGDDPWLAVVSLHAPHTPLEAPPEGCSYRAAGADAPTEDIDIYKDMVECMDRRIGDLLAGIDDLDDTFVVFIGDNGTTDGVTEGVFDDGRGKATLFESGVRVPMIMADGRTLAAGLDGFTFTTDWLRSRRFLGSTGVSSSALVHTVDLFATIAEVMGADGSSGEDSVSLLPILDGSASEVHDFIYTEYFDTSSVGGFALRQDNWKLLVRTNDPAGTPCRQSYALFNLDGDRFEHNDVAATAPAVVEGMLGLLDTLSATAASTPWFELDDC